MLCWKWEFHWGWKKKQRKSNCYEQTVSSNNLLHPALLLYNVIFYKDIVFLLPRLCPLSCFMVIKHPEPYAVQGVGWKCYKNVEYLPQAAQQKRLFKTHFNCFLNYFLSRGARLIQSWWVTDQREGIFYIVIQSQHGGGTNIQIQKYRVLGEGSKQKGRQICTPEATGIWI